MGASAKSLVAVGSYAAAGGLTTWWGDGKGEFTQAGVADVESPSFACWHPAKPVLYAVSELADDRGSVTAFAVGPDGSLTAGATISTGGSEPCWIAPDPSAAALLVANYDITRGHSSFATIRLAADGSFTGDVTIVRHSGSGPVRGRQDASHIHQAVPTPQGSVLASDLGADELTEYDVSPRGVVEVGRTAMPAGSGPRHMALSSDGSTGFVSCELGAAITVIRRGPGGRWAAAEQVPSTGIDGVPADQVLPSQIRLAGGDRWLLVANRGTNTLAALEVSGGLRIASEIPVTAYPRHFTVAGAGGGAVAVLVAGQHGDSVEAVRLETTTGKLESMGPVAEVPSASCVAIRAS